MEVQTHEILELNTKSYTEENLQFLSDNIQQLLAAGKVKELYEYCEDINGMNNLMNLHTGLLNQKIDMHCKNIVAAIEEALPNEGEIVESIEEFQRNEAKIKQPEHRLTGNGLSELRDFMPSPAFWAKATKDTAYAIFPQGFEDAWVPALRHLGLTDLSRTPIELSGMAPHSGAGQAGKASANFVAFVVLSKTGPLPLNELWQLSLALSPDTVTKKNSSFRHTLSVNKAFANSQSEKTWSIATHEQYAEAIAKLQAKKEESKKIKNSGSPSSGEMNGCESRSKKRKSCFSGKNGPERNKIVKLSIKFDPTMPASPPTERRETPNAGSESVDGSALAILPTNMLRTDSTSALTSSRRGSTNNENTNKTDESSNMATSVSSPPSKQVSEWIEPPALSLSKQKMTAPTANQIAQREAHTQYLTQPQSAYVKVEASGRCTVPIPCRLKDTNLPMPRRCPRNFEEFGCSCPCVLHPNQNCACWRKLKAPEDD